MGPATGSGVVTILRSLTLSSPSTLHSLSERIWLYPRLFLRSRYLLALHLVILAGLDRRRIGYRESLRPLWPPSVPSPVERVILARTRSHQGTIALSYSRRRLRLPMIRTKLYLPSVRNSPPTVLARSETAFVSHTGTRICPIWAAFLMCLYPLYSVWGIILEETRNLCARWTVRISWCCTTQSRGNS